MTDATGALRRALVRSAADAGIALAIDRAEAVRWASATFAGARHELTLRVGPADRAAAWLRALPEAELPIRNHLVADLKLVSAQEAAAVLTAVVEVLTVEER